MAEGIGIVAPVAKGVPEVVFGEAYHSIVLAGLSGVTESVLGKASPVHKTSGAGGVGGFASQISVPPKFQVQSAPALPSTYK